MRSAPLSPTPAAEVDDHCARVNESRKQREIRLREAKILQVAREQILEGGYLGLNMDRIAARIEYSKGTIYQHFRNKEEILLALVNEALQTRLCMFRKAASVEGPTRVRLATVGAAAEAFVEHFPFHFKVEQIIRAESIWEKTSPERRQLMRACEKGCMGTVIEILHNAVESGDLTLPEGTKAEEIVFGMWSIYLGVQIISHSSDTLAEIGIDSPVKSLRTNQTMMLDGYGWKPLSSEFDYPGYIERIKREEFGREQFAD